jgi:hypothetical protein
MMAQRSTMAGVVVAIELVELPGARGILARRCSGHPSMSA